MSLNTSQGLLTQGGGSNNSIGTLDTQQNEQNYKYQGNIANDSEAYDSSGESSFLGNQSSSFFNKDSVCLNESEEILDFDSRSLPKAGV